MDPNIVIIVVSLRLSRFTVLSPVVRILLYFFKHAYLMRYSVIMTGYVAISKKKKKNVTMIMMPDNTV